MRRLVAAMLFCLTFAGCATESTESERVVADDGTIVLRPADTKALLGTWEGTFTLDDGFAGETTLTIVESAPGSVRAYFEFRWNPGGYERYPVGENTLSGAITSRGALSVGGWELWLSEEGADYRFTAYGNVGGKPGTLQWSRPAQPRLEGT